MKLNILLIYALLVILGQTLVPKNLNSHKFEKTDKIDHRQENEMVKKVKHEQDPYSMKVVEIATTKTMDKLLNDPTAAAQIPTKVIKGQIDGLIEAFSGAWNIKDRYRSLQLTFVNLTPQTVENVESYFNSGTWFETWMPEMKSKSITQGTVANSQGSFFCGVTGSLKLSIVGTNLYIYLGFNNPAFGSYKFSGSITSENKAASYGYDISNNNSPKLIKVPGYKLQIVQAQSSIAQMAFVYQLSTL